MPNPTTITPTTQVEYNDMGSLWPIPSTADTYYPGELFGMRASDGLGQHFDDTQSLTFLGLIVTTPRFVVTTDLPPQALLLRYRRPRLFSMPLLTGTASRITDIDKPVYAADSGHVQLSAAGLSFANLVGYVADVLTARPEDMTGSAVYIVAAGAGAGLRGGGGGGVLTAPATGGKTYGKEALNATIFVPNSAAETLTLPPVASTVPGDTITVCKTTAAAFAVTLKGNGAELINGANTYATTAVQFATAVVVSDGSQWIVTNGKVL